MLLLTATPEQLGAEGHFARLRLLDPERYPDLDKFRQEQSEYSKVAAVASKMFARKKLSSEDLKYIRKVFEEYTDEEFNKRLEDQHSMLEELVDRHGTGRVIFRNSRDSLTGFPKREGLPSALMPPAKLPMEALEKRLLHEFELDTSKGKEEAVSYDFRHGPRILWLAELIKGLGENEKVLLICCTREKVQAIHDALLEEINVKAGLFHEDLTLLQRDRNAAWFAEADGAKILLCSESWR